MNHLRWLGSAAKQCKACHNLRWYSNTYSEILCSVRAHNYRLCNSLKALRFNDLSINNVKCSNYMSSRENSVKNDLNGIATSENEVESSHAVNTIEGDIATDSLESSSDIYSEKNICNEVTSSSSDNEHISSSDIHSISSIAVQDKINTKNFTKGRVKPYILFEKSDSIEIIMQHFDEGGNFYPEEVYYGLRKIIALNESDKFLEGLRNDDPVFKKVLSSLEGSAALLNPYYTLNLFLIFLRMFEMDISTVFIFADRVRQLTARMPFAQLLRLTKALKFNASTPLREDLFSYCKIHLRRRWLEVDNGNSFIHFMNIFGNDPEISEKMGLRMMEFIGDFGPMDLYRTLLLLAKNRSRNTPVLRALCHYLASSEETGVAPIATLSLSQLSDILRALVTLSLFNCPTLVREIGRIVMKGKDIDSHTAIAILTSLSFLKHSNHSLLMLLVEKGLVSGVSEVELLNLLRSCSNLNYSGPTETLVQTCESMMKAVNWKKKILVAFHLAQLKAIEGRTANAVLFPKQLSSILDEIGQQEDYVSVSTKFHLLNICAELRLKGICIGLLQTPRSLGLTEKHMDFMRRGPSFASTLLLETLPSTFPQKGYLKENVILDSGYFINAEVVVDSQGRPLPLDAYRSTEGASRIALICTNYHDTLSDGSYCGYFNMALRHIKDCGYGVVLINEQEFAHIDNVVARVMYIQKKIENVLEEKRLSSITD